jgi:hypothetical protein
MVKKIEIKLSDVFKKDLKLVCYLLASGVLGWLLATYVAKDPVLVAVFAPAINYLLVRLTKEVENQGYREALKNS